MIKQIFIFSLGMVLLLGSPAAVHAAKPKPAEKAKSKAGVDSAAEAKRKAVDAKKTNVKPTTTTSEIFMVQTSE